MAYLKCFNPRPRAGGDRSQFSHGVIFAVSIHAPARGATLGPDDVSATNAFQSTPPRGGRRVELETVVVGGDVSIHAPARGATKRPVDNDKQHRVSIHAPARGATTTTGQTTPFTMFQSTPPRGGRPPAFLPARSAAGFNPRPRAGGDRGNSLPTQATVSFNPRPRAGGDRRVKRPSYPRRVSIHAPARGATSKSTVSA